MSLHVRVTDDAESAAAWQDCRRREMHGGVEPLERPGLLLKGWREEVDRGMEHIHLADKDAVKIKLSSAW